MVAGQHQAEVEGRASQRRVAVMTDEDKCSPPTPSPRRGEGSSDDRSPTEWAQTVKAALAGASHRITSPSCWPTRLGYDDTPLYALLVTVKATAIWWQTLLDAPQTRGAGGLMAFYTGRVAQQYPSLQLIDETIEKQLDNQISHIDSLDTKAGILFGFLAVTLGTAAGSKDFFEAVGRYNALKIATVAVVFGFLLTIGAFSVREYRRDPNPRALREQYPNQPEDTTRFALADAYVVSFELNLAKISQKVRLLQATLLLSAIGGIAFAVHLIFQL